MQEGQRILVNGFREVAGTTLPLWCNGHAGTVQRVENGIVVAVLDKITTAKGQPEFRFRPDELKPE